MGAVYVCRICAFCVCVCIGALAWDESATGIGGRESEGAAMKWGGQC